jgi:hypothetical protein
MLTGETIDMLALELYSHLLKVKGEKTRARVSLQHEEKMRKLTVEWPAYLASKYANSLPANIHTLVFEKTHTDWNVNDEGYANVEDTYAEQAEFAHLVYTCKNNSATAAKVSGHYHESTIKTISSLAENHAADFPPLLQYAIYDIATRHAYLEFCDDDEESVEFYYTHYVEFARKIQAAT